MIALAACWFLVAAALTYGEFVTAAVTGDWERALTPGHGALVAAGVATFAGIVAVALMWLRRGVRLAAEPALAALVLVLALAQVHVAWRLVYQEGDVPKDMLVYTQTSPDMHRMVGELTTLSAMTTGSRDLEIWYDDNWPMQWYLRDFPNRHLYGGTLAGPPDDVPVVLVGDKNEPRRAVPGGLHRSGVRPALVVPGRPRLPRVRYRPRDQPGTLGVEIVRPAARPARHRRLHRREPRRTCSRQRDSRDSTAW